MVASISARPTVARLLMFATMQSDLERQATPSDTHPAPGEPVAVDLANTLFTDGGRPLDALTTPAALRRWLEANDERIDPQLPARLGAGDLERARDLRVTIRELLAAAVDDNPPPAVAVSRLNEIAALAPLSARLQWPAGEPPKAHLSLAGADRFDALLALLAQSAIDVLGGSGAGRLRRCEAPGCSTYFLKDHPRRAWCSPTCGNRVRVARHYHRTRRAGS